MDLELEVNENMNANDIGALEEALSALDDETPVEEIVEKTIEEIEAVEEPTTDDLSDDFLADLEIAAAKQSAYEQQASTEMPDIAETIATGGAIKTKKTRSTSKGVSAPKQPRDLAAVPADFFLLSNDQPPKDADEMTAEKTAVMSKRPTQVKIAEKFDNLFLQLSVGKKPSTYVMLAFDLLKAKGEFTSTDLVNHYKANGLGDGTARSQTGQIMVLFNVVGIADRVGQTMKARSNSMIADRISALTTSAAPATA